jgi:CBS domain-containing protein
MKARDIMTANPEVVTPDQQLSVAAQIMRDCDIGMVPVVTDTVSRTLVGLITDRDIALRHVAEDHRDGCTVGAHMTRDDIATVHDNDESFDVLDTMKRREVRRIPVTNDRGTLLGIVAQADIAVHRAISREDVAEVVTQISEPGHPAR